MAENKDKSPIVREHFELNIGNALKINGEVVSIEITSLEIKRELSGHSTLDMILYKKDEENWVFPSIQELSIIKLITRIFLITKIVTIQVPRNSSSSA